MATLERNGWSFLYWRREKFGESTVEWCSAAAATDDFIERHLALVAVGQADDGHAKVHQIGDDGKQRDFLAAVLGRRRR